MARRPQQFAMQDQGLDPSVAFGQQPQYAQSPEAAQLTQDTLGGNFLQEENPYMQGVIDKANADVNRGLEQQQANLSRASLRPGLLGSTVWQGQRQALDASASQAMADAANQTRFQGYEAERGRQQDLLGLDQARNAAIWGDLTARRGQDLQQESDQAARVASARAGAASGWAQEQAARLNAQTQEAQIRANLLLGQGDLAERARQFDAGMPLQWANLLGGQIGQYGQQNAQDLQGLGSLIGQQMGAQQGAAGLTGQLGQAGAGFDLQGAGQQLQAAGMLPGFEQAGLAGMGMAGDFLSQLYGSQTGLQAAQAAANASRSNARLADQFQRDQLGYQSALNQWGYNNPQNAMNDYFAGLGQVGGLAGGTQTGYGRGAPAAGAVVDPGDDGTGEAAMAGLSLAMMFGY